ncbi:hypothetical protein GCM10027614_38990 [Micromonospora vulcania]
MSRSITRSVPDAHASEDDVVTGAGRGVAEDQQQPAVGRHPAADQCGHLGDQSAERIDQVDGQVRTCGVPARPGEPDGDVVRGGGDRAHP